MTQRRPYRRSRRDQSYNTPAVERPNGPAPFPPELAVSGPGAGVQLRFGNVTQIHDLTVIELARSVRLRELSAVEITDHYLRRIEAKNADVGAFFTVTADLARGQAAQGRCRRSPGCPSRSRT